MLGLIGAGIGLIAGLFMSVFGTIMGTILSTASNDANPGLIAVFGIGGIIFFPIFYGVTSFVGGIIMAFVINLALKITKGLDVSIEE